MAGGGRGSKGGRAAQVMKGFSRRTLGFILCETGSRWQIVRCCDAPYVVSGFLVLRELAVGGQGWVQGDQLRDKQ